MKDGDATLNALNWFDWYAWDSMPSVLQFMKIQITPELITHLKCRIIDLRKLVQTSNYPLSSYPLNSP